MSKSHYLSTGTEWDFHLLKTYDKEIAKIAAGYQLDTYPTQIEIISAEQMMDAYASIGMPINYSHWSYGKQFLTTEKSYKRGQMGLAYEIVINSNPCIAYLMEENSIAMQALVIAHAAYGHNSFFKNNYLFKTWTSADAIIDYLVFSKKYITDCEERYGLNKVEEILDACHALMNYGVDRYQRPPKLSIQEEKARQKRREDYMQNQVNELWRTIPEKKSQEISLDTMHFPSEPQENILYFVEKNAPLLEPWQREIVRIVRKIAQYFYPQKQTKLMNEGWACFWHYTLINELYNKKLVTDEFMMEVLQNHTNVIHQPAFDDPHYTGLNPYTLGYHMFQDIRRICEDPTDEDKLWFPELVNTPWVESLHFAMQHFKDESFIAQYLSPKLIRDLRLFSISNDDEQNELEVSAIHNEQGYQKIRTILSQQYNLSLIEPNIQVHQVDVRGDRTLTLRHIQHNRIPLDPSYTEVLKHLHQLWQFPVRLESLDPHGTILMSTDCPEAEEKRVEGPSPKEKDNDSPATSS